MRLFHDDIDDLTTRPWVRLARRGATMWLGHWPGPHRPGEVIYITGGGRFEFDADDDPEAVYTWAA